MKSALYFTLGGVLLGIALTAWLAPRLIVWYFNPPVEVGFSCNAPITWALHRLLWAQLGGVVVGGALGLGVYGLIQRRRRGTLASPGQGPEGASNEPMPPR
jgi:hypothetical protein